jgi:hypothetical protein
MYARILLHYNALQVMTPPTLLPGGLGRWNDLPCEGALRKAPHTAASIAEGIDGARLAHLLFGSLSHVVYVMHAFAN